MAKLVQDWHDIMDTPQDRYSWDRLRRYERRGGTGFARFMKWYLWLPPEVPFDSYCYQGEISRTGIPGFLVFGCYIIRPQGADYVAFGPTPLYPIAQLRVLPWAPPLFLALTPDLWPTKRVFCRFYTSNPFGGSTGRSGLYATTAHG